MHKSMLPAPTRYCQKESANNLDWYRLFKQAQNNIIFDMLSLKFKSIAIMYRLDISCLSLLT